MAKNYGFTIAKLCTEFQFSHIATESVSGFLYFVRSTLILSGCTTFILFTGKIKSVPLGSFTRSLMKLAPSIVLFIDQIDLPLIAKSISLFAGIGF